MPLVLMKEVMKKDLTRASSICLEPEQYNQSYNGEQNDLW